MLLAPLFEKQLEVDTYIERNLLIHMDDVETVDKRVHAFKVEVGEFSNETGWFKYWKTSHKMDRAKTLEELADCMAFLLSVGISRKYVFVQELDARRWWKVPRPEMFEFLLSCSLESAGEWKTAFETLLGIGLKLGFSTGEMEAAYYEKSDKNIERQKQNY
jgi:dimeric dUTPase (all-alpha-NTP-PPase superfamily)